MNKLEVEEEDGGDPAVDGVVWVKSGVVDHAFDELGVHLNNKLLDSDGVDLRLPKGSEESVEFELGLRVSRLAVMEGEGAEPTGVALLIGTDLKEDVANTIHARINCEDDRLLGLVVEGAKCRGGSDLLL